MGAVRELGAGLIHQLEVRFVDELDRVQRLALPEPAQTLARNGAELFVEPGLEVVEGFAVPRAGGVEELRRVGGQCHCGAHGPCPGGLKIGTEPPPVSTDPAQTRAARRGAPPTRRRLTVAARAR